MGLAIDFAAAPAVRIASSIVPYGVVSDRTTSRFIRALR
jgi:hypothetical protein